MSEGFKQPKKRMQAAISDRVCPNKSAAVDEILAKRAIARKRWKEKKKLK